MLDWRQIGPSLDSARSSSSSHFLVVIYLLPYFALCFWFSPSQAHFSHQDTLSIPFALDLFIIVITSCCSVESAGRNLYLDIIGTSSVVSLICSTKRPVEARLGCVDSNPRHRANRPHDFNLNIVWVDLHQPAKGMVSTRIGPCVTDLERARLVRR